MPPQRSMMERAIRHACASAGARLQVLAAWIRCLRHTTRVPQQTTKTCAHTLSLDALTRGHSTILAAHKGSGSRQNVRMPYTAARSWQARSTMTLVLPSCTSARFRTRGAWFGQQQILCLQRTCALTRPVYRQRSLAVPTPSPSTTTAAQLFPLDAHITSLDAQTRRQPRI